MARMNERGQMLLIGALVIAATFISLGVVLNGSLHTPSIAAEASDNVRADQPYQLRDTLRRETTSFITTANDQFSSFSEREAYIEKNISSLGSSLERYYATQDVALTIEDVSAEPGRKVDTSLVAGDSSESYSNTEVRYFDVDTSNLDSSDSVTVRFDDGGTVYDVVISEGTVEVSGETCPHNDRIEITNASTDTGACPPLEFVGELEGNYDVEIQTAGLSSGRIEYDFYEKGSGPWSEHVYETRIEFSYYSPTVTYDGQFIIAPGEPQ